MMTVPSTSATNRILKLKNVFRHLMMNFQKSPDAQSTDTVDYNIFPTSWAELLFLLAVMS